MITLAGPQILTFLIRESVFAESSGLRPVHLIFDILKVFSEKPDVSTVTVKKSIVSRIFAPSGSVAETSKLLLVEETFLKSIAESESSLILPTTSGVPIIVTVL